MNAIYGDPESLIDSQLKWFDRNTDGWSRLSLELKSAAEDRLKAAGIAHFRVETRVKTGASFETKLRKDPLRDVEDVVGIRVLVFFRSDLARVEKVMQQMLIFDPASYVDKANLLQDSEFGYRSIQFVGRTKEDGWDATPHPIWEVGVVTVGQKVEVQIRTLLEHAFAEVEHDIRYKPGPLEVPAEVHRRFALTAALLEQADTNLDDIRAMLHLHPEGPGTSRAADLEGWDAKRFTQASRASIELDHQVRTALDLKKGHVPKSMREVTHAASLAGWKKFLDYKAGVEKYGELGRRLAIACADTSRGLVLIDYEQQHKPIGYPGIGLFWTSLAVALGVNDLDPALEHDQIAIPDGRLAEFKAVAQYLMSHPEMPAPTVRDRYRVQAAPAGTTSPSGFHTIELA